MTAPFCPKTGKIAYANRPDAINARDKILERDKARHKTQVFFCEVCRLWHIGRVPPAKSMPIRRPAE